jgi:hypothetical protein
MHVSRIEADRLGQTAYMGKPLKIYDTIAEAQEGYKKAYEEAKQELRRETRRNSL